MQRLVFGIVVGFCSLSITAGAACAEPEWRVMPVRSQDEYGLGMIGGENTQHMHGTARSESHPDVIYMAHDCAQTWRSSDSGATWRKSLCRGMHLTASQSIEVDPVKAEERIRELIPEEAQITDVFFAPDTGEVTIEARTPGVAIGKHGSNLNDIKRQIGWAPKVIRTPSIPSKTVIVAAS